LNIPATRMLRHCRRAKSGNCNKLECRLRVNSRAHYKVWHAGLYRGTSFEQQRSKLSVAMILRVDVEYVGHWMYATHVEHDDCASIERSRADIAKQLRLHVLGRDFCFCYSPIARGLFIATLTVQHLYQSHIIQINL
jgi:hypothetical protein